MRRLALLVLALLARPVPASAGEPTVDCVIKGKASLDGELHASATGASPLLVLHLSAPPVPWELEARELPDDTANGRLRLRARNPTYGLRVEGFLDAEGLALYAARDLAVVSGTLSIARGARLRLLRTKTLEAEPLRPRHAAVRAKVACADLALDPPPREAAEPPAKTWVPKTTPLPLHASPSGAAVFQLVPVSGARIELSAVENKNGFVHVRFDDEIKIDAWVRLVDLAPPKPQPKSAPGLLSGIEVKEPPFTKMRVAKETDVLLAASATAPRAAIVEKNVVVRAYGAVSGFTVVALEGVSAPSGKTLHVRTDALVPVP